MLLTTAAYRTNLNVEPSGSRLPRHRHYQQRRWHQRRRTLRIITRLGLLIGTTALLVTMLYQGMALLLVSQPGGVLFAHVWRQLLPPINTDPGSIDRPLSELVWDPQRQLTAVETTSLMEIINALDPALQSTTRIRIQHPLSQTAWLPQRGIFLGYDPVNQHLIVQLGVGLLERSVLLGDTAASFLTSELTPIARQPLRTGTKLQLMLKLIGAHYLPGFYHSQITLPSSSSVLR